MRINFLHPVFQPGVNSTVRDGLRPIVIGTPVELFETGADEPTATGKVVMVFLLEAGAVNESMLIHQHDVETRTVAGLWAAMQRGYDREFAPTDPVTIIFFTVEPPEHRVSYEIGCLKSLEAFPPRGE
jgi:hypothetical protein